MARRYIFAILALTLLAAGIAPGRTDAGDADVQQVLKWPEEWAPLSTTQYPPYPDVWWRETPEAVRKRGGIGLYDAGGVDPLVLHFWNPTDSSVLDMQAQEFFSGRTWEPFVRDGQKSIEPYGQKELTYIAQTPFPDGSALGLVGRAGLDWTYSSVLGCFVGALNHALFLKDKNGRVIWERFLIQKLKKPRTQSFYRRYCGVIVEGEGEDPANFYVDVAMRWNFLSFGFSSSPDNDYESLDGISRLVMLKDGTFLASPTGYAERGNPYVIRFDKNMHSPFFDHHDDMFVVDMEELKPLLALAKRYEEIHDINPLGYFEGLLNDYLLARGSPYPKE